MGRRISLDEQDNPRFGDQDEIESLSQQLNNTTRWTVVCAVIVDR